MKLKVLATAILLLIAVGIALVAYHRASGTGGTPSVAEPVDRRFRTDDREDGAGGRYSRGSIAEDTRNAVERAARVVIDGASAQQAAQVAALRADLMFDPDFDVWVDRIVDQTGVDPSQYDQDFRERWERSLAPYQDPIIDPESVWAERIDPDRSFPAQEPGTLIMRSDNALEAPYEPFAGAPFDGPDERDAIEFFFPIRATDADGAPMGVTVSIVLARETRSVPWREVEMFIYIGANGFGRPIMTPGF